MLEASLDDAAEEIVFHDRPVKLDPPPRVTLGESFRLDPVAAREAVALTETAPVLSWRARDVLLDGKTASLRWRGRLLRETASGVPDDAPAPTTSLDAVVTLPRDVLVVLGFNAAWTTAHGWIAHCLPAIDTVMRRTDPDLARLILPPTAPAQASWLRLLGHTEQPVFVAEPARTYHLPHGEFCSLLGRARGPLARPARATWERIVARVPEMPGPRAIFVTETSTPLRDPDGLRRIAEEAGFTPVAPSALSVAEQVNVFRGARVVMAPRADALAGIAFCRPGSVVYELMPTAAPGARSNHVAQTAGLDYHADLFPCGAAGMEVDRDAVLRRLQGIADAASRRSGGQTANPEAPG